MTVIVCRERRGKFARYRSPADGQTYEWPEHRQYKGSPVSGVRRRIAHAQGGWGGVAAFASGPHTERVWHGGVFVAPEGVRVSCYGCGVVGDASEFATLPFWVPPAYAKASETAWLHAASVWLYCAECRAAVQMARRVVRDLNECKRLTKTLIHQTTNGNEDEGHAHDGRTAGVSGRPHHAR